jgi:hypothetical protein
MNDAFQQLERVEKIDFLATQDAPQWCTTQYPFYSSPTHLPASW